jgi:microsomal dipeptidase-like Zn-dependent dipeptidase
VKAANSAAPFVRVTENGKLVPAELEVIDYVAKHPDLVLETGHVSGEEGDLVVHEAHQRGVAHIVVTHAMASYVRMTIPQMQAAAADGAFIEFVYGATLGLHPAVTISDYAKAIRAIGPKSCILATDFGSVQKPPEPQRPLEPQGFLDFMNALHKEGISVEDINVMAKTNPALALGLKP